MIHAAAISVCLSSMVSGRAVVNLDLSAAEFDVAAALYGEATEALKRARAAPGNDHATLLHILDLTGVVAATSGDAGAAQDAFRELLAVEPTFKLEAKWGPKVRAAFDQAREWSQQAGTLQWSALPPQASGGAVRQLAFKLDHDPVGAAKQVRVHLVGASAPLKARLEVGAPSVRVSVAPAAQVRWWAELLDQNEAVLGQLGSALEPQLSTPSMARPEPAIPLVAITPSAPAPSPDVPLRIPAYSLLAGGAVTFGVGLVFGAESGSIDSQLKGAARNAQGQVTAMTQKQAYALNAQAANEQTAANVLFAVGAVAAASGAAFWVYGAVEADSPGGGSVAISPAPTGLVVAGVFP